MGVPVVASSAVGAASSLDRQTQAVVLAQSAEPRSVLAAIRTFLDRREEIAAKARVAVPGIRSRYGRQAVAKAHLELVYGHAFNKSDEQL
jgi:hypothetical protein